MKFNADTINEMLGDAETTLDDLVALKEAVASAIKARREEAKVAEKLLKETAKEQALTLKDRVTIGAMVSFTYKGRAVTARVDKVTDKTFHVNADEFGLDYKAGGQLYRYVSFDKLVAIVAPAPAPAASVAAE